MKSFDNLDKEGKIKRSKHCAIGCIIIAIVILCLMWYGNISVSRKEAMCTSVTNGTVYSINYGSRYSTPSVSAKFTVNETLYYTSGRSSYPHSNIGEQITVYYYPEDPSISYTGDGLKRPHIVFYLIAVVFIAGCPLFFKQAKMTEQTKSL